MKITSNNPLLPKKPLPRRTNYKTTPRLSRNPRLNTSSGGPPTPLLRWNHREITNKSDEIRKVNNVDSPEARRKSTPAVSARKIGAAFWRLQVESEVAGEEGDNVGDRLGFKQGIGNRECGSDPKDQLRSPCSVNGPIPINEYLRERKSPFQYANYEMEGATKWDPINLKQSDENSDDTKLLDLQTELEKARVRIEELKVERQSSKKKVEHFLKKLSEERSTWRSKEHEKVRAIIDDIKRDLSRERKYKQRLEIVNSKLVNEVAEVKSTSKRYMNEYEKERKARELIEEVCDELAKEIGEDKAEVDSLRNECMKIREEVDGERKMLQMAEVWREERVQMKLIDAKVALDQKYSQMIYLVDELENFLNSKGVTLDGNELKQAEIFRRATSSMNIKDIKEFKYEPSNADDIFDVVEEMGMAESNEREIDIEPCVEHSKDIHRVSNIYGYQNGEDQGSTCSGEGSIMSVNRMCRDSNVSGSYSEWEEQVDDETPITEITEVYSVPLKQQKQVNSTFRVSNGVMMSPDCGSSKGGGFSPSNMGGWSSPESGDTHVNRGMKGCIEWPRGGQRNSLKNKLMEARMESQKIQLRHVLKDKI